MKMATDRGLVISALWTLNRAARRAARMVMLGYRAVVARFTRWQRLAYERRLLAAMDVHQLKDIGITRAQAMQESARPFWDEAGTTQSECETGGKLSAEKVNAWNRRGAEL